jgi:hypothetical protein
MVFLTELDPAGWRAPTVVPGRSVKDIAGHMVDGTIRRLSHTRDGYNPPDGPGMRPDHDAIVDYIQELNGAWIRAFRRVSPALVVDLLAHLEPQLWDHWQHQDLEADAPYGVTWAGAPRAPVWLDIAREYTEKWHHQAQIRDAVGASGIREPELFEPVLATFALGFPYAFRDHPCEPGRAVRIQITGRCGGEWTVLRGRQGWQLTDSEADLAATLRLDQELAWRLFTNSIDRADAARSLEVDGDEGFASPLLRMVAIMAPVEGAPPP